MAKNDQTKSGEQEDGEQTKTKVLFIRANPEQKEQIEKMILGKGHEHISPGVLEILLELASEYNQTRIKAS